MRSDSPDFLWMCLALVLGVCLLRSMFVIRAGQTHLPEKFKLFAQFAFISILAALAIPGILAPVGEVAFLLGKERMVAGFFAAFVAWKSHSLILTIASGLGALYLLEWLNLEYFTPQSAI